jgi:nicotinate-nucleotide pyrophosphorylase (carboxylating)
MKRPLSARYLDAFLQAAFAEDIGSGDITTEAAVPQGQQAEAVCIAREKCVAAGIPFALRAFALLDRRMKVLASRKDGSRLRRGETAFRVRGSARAILSAERTALNVLGRLSGVATLAAGFAERVKGTRAVILDTRKTTPLMRALEKYAVRAGGARNHRFGLHDAVLLKENHIAMAGGVREALRRVRKWKGRAAVEIEVRNLKELKEALDAGAEWVMLDNFSVPLLRRAVKETKGRALLEASGGVNLKNIRRVAETGVDFISVGALTHSAPAADFSLLVEARGNRA